MNDSVNKSVDNKRNKSVFELNPVAKCLSTVIVEEARESKHPNFRGKQFSLLNRYNDIHIDN